MKNKYDVCIVGSGLVGSVFSLCLSKSKLTRNLRICVIDKESNLQKEKIGNIGLRTSALAPSSLELMERIGAGEVGKGRKFTEMHVWDGSNGDMFNFSKLGHLHFKNSQGLGIIMDNREILYHLHQVMMDEDQIELLDGQVKTARVDDDYAVLKCVDGSEIHSKLLVAADGANSAIRNILNFPSHQINYEQRAFVTSVKTNFNHDTALQRFIPTGPIAMLPVGDYISNIVWSTTPEEAFMLQKLTDNELADRINESFSKKFTKNSENIFSESLKFMGTVLDDFAPAEKLTIPEVQSILPNEPINRGSFPLKQMHADSYCKNRVALIGDAAHAVHPLAGQGVNLGFSDCAQLTKALQYCLETGSDIGSELMLKKHYEEKQYWNNQMNLVGLDSLKSLFSTENELVGIARGVGMHVIDQVLPIKQSFHHLASHKMAVHHVGEVKNEIFN